MTISPKTSYEEWKAWFARVFDAQHEIATFVAQHCHSKPSGKPKFHRGSFNLCVEVSLADGGPDAIIRIPQPGHSAFREEKILKEVGAMVALQQNSIPVPALDILGLDS
jgi:hypothetical protein